MSDTLSREQKGVTGVSHTLSMELPAFNEFTTVSLDYTTAGFTLDAGSLTSISSTTGTVSAIASATGVDIVCTAGVGGICGGAFSGSFISTNPSSSGSKTITISGDSGVTGSFAIPIVDSDQVTVTASVDPSITFNVGAQVPNTTCDGTFSGNGGTVTLGSLLTSQVTSSSDAVTPTPLYFPQGMAYDSVHKRLFVADPGNGRVVVFNTSGGISDDMAASYVLGQPDFSTTTQNRGSGFADVIDCDVGDGTANRCSLAGPENLAYDPSGNRLFVADSVNFRVLVFDVSSISNGQAAAHVLGQPDFTFSQYNKDTGFADTINCPDGSDGTPNPCGMNGPSGIAYDDSTNRLYITDNQNNRITVFNVASISDGQAAAHVLGQPDFSNNVSDKDTGFADTINCPDGSDGTPNSCGMQNPAGVGLDVSGHRLFVADTGNQRVTIFDTSSLSDGQAAAHVLGQPDFSTNDINRGSGFGTPGCNVGNGTINACSLYNTEGVTFDSVDNLIVVADSQNNRITTYASSLSDGDPYTHVLHDGNLAGGTVPHICTRLSTNATSGAVVTVKSDNASLKSSSVPADTIPSSTATLTAGTTGYGLCAGSSGSASGMDTTDPVSAAPAASSPYSSTCTATDYNVGALATTPSTVWSVAGPSSNAFYRLYLMAAISPTTKAHTDYADTLTFVATGTF